MKQIFLFLAAAFAFTACDPVEEDFSNAGGITKDQLIAKTVVTVDKSSDGKNGNVVSCETFAPVNAKWTIAGKEYVGNYAWKKMKIGEHVVTLTALCADGTELTADFSVRCDVITNALERFYIYGAPESGEKPFKPGAWNAAAMRFSANEGKFVDIEGNEGSLPYLSDDIYWGFKTLIFDISEATDDCFGRIMNGWWSARYDGDKDVQFTNGLWELPLTEAIAKDCAQGNGGSGKDLDLMVTSGSCQINSIYYEE
ncbi:MAG: hypothetical protein Q4C30_09595 [Bacteroidia bacterium]|nr:hypothetical protein [Bacteroidia bacterium]